MRAYSGCEEGNEAGVISFSDTIMQVRAMMIYSLYTIPALSFSVKSMKVSAPFSS
jgi:hypothetical protein